MRPRVLMQSGILPDVVMQRLSQPMPQLCNTNNESRDTWPRPAPQKIITQEFDGVEDLLCLVQMVQKPVRVSPCPIEVLARSDLLPWDVNLLGWSAQWIKPVIGFLEHFYFLAGNHDVG